MRQYIYLFITLTLMITAGCATMSPKAVQQKEIEDKAKLTQSYYQQGVDLEKEGKFVEAGKRYKMALTVDPDNKVAQKADQRMEDKLKRIANIHFRLGSQYAKKGKKRLAELEYLKTLHYYPDHPGALQMLKRSDSYPQGTTVPVETGKYIVHVLKTGESLSKLAKLYYGDYKKYPILAQFNHLPDATHIVVGQKIKIPQIEGFQMPDKETAEKAPPPAAIDEAAQKQGEVMEGTQEVQAPPAEITEASKADALTAKSTEEQGVTEEQDVTQPAAQPEDQAANTSGTAINKPADSTIPPAKDEQVATAPQSSPSDASKVDAAMEAIAAEEEKAEERPEPEEDSSLELVAQYMDKGIISLNNNKYDKAITEFGKVIALEPENTAAMEHLSKAYFQNALALYDKNDYLGAKKGFESSLKYDPACDRCAAYIQKCETIYKEYNYNRGVAYLENEQLAEAIKAWELVYAIDPNYKNVANNIKKYKILLKRLEEIKKKNRQ